MSSRESVTIFSVSDVAPHGYRAAHNPRALCHPRSPFTKGHPCDMGPVARSSALAICECDTRESIDMRGGSSLEIEGVQYLSDSVE